MKQLMSLVVWMAAGLLTSSSPAQAQPPQVEFEKPVYVTELVFASPRDVTIRQKTGIPARGKLISITATEVTMRTLRDKEVHIDLEDIRNIRSSDGALDWDPKEESFDELVRRSNRIAGLSVSQQALYGDDAAVATAAGQATAGNAAPMHAAQTGPDLQGLPPNLNAKPVDAATTPTDVQTTAAETTDDSDPAPGTTIYMCEKCGKELPASIEDGDRCPHCNTVIWNAPRPKANPANSNPFGSADAGDAQRKPGVFDEGAAAPGAAAAAPSAAATAPASTSGGLLDSFNAAPTWMKAGFCIGMLALAYMLFFRR